MKIYRGVREIQSFKLFALKWFTKAIRETTLTPLYVVVCMYTIVRRSLLNALFVVSLDFVPTFQFVSRDYSNSSH